jgi:hypothetical protein
MVLVNIIHEDISYYSPWKWTRWLGSVTDRALATFLHVCIEFEYSFLKIVEY